MLAAELLAFAIVLFALFWARQRQMTSLQQQAFYLRRFAEGVSTWRGSTGIPSDARQAIEFLIDMPLDKRVTRGFARSMLQQRSSPKLEENFFWVARSQLDGEKREAFDWLLLNYFLAMTYSDWLTGPFIRQFRVIGLSRETQAEIAIETVFSRGVVHAPA
jgi:hypothetical protein